MLPTIQPSSHPEAFGRTRADGPFGAEVVIGGVLGDQQAAMVGQVCLDAGEAKNTYGPANFLLLNPGEELTRSENGLLTTVCYQFGDAKPVYALEGSIAVTGSAVQWLGDQLRVISGGGAGAARPAGDLLGGGAERGPRPPGRGQRRRLFRARVLRSVRPVLAIRRARR